MDATEVKEIALRVLALKEKIAYVKRGMCGKLHQVAYTLTDERFPRFEHFVEEAMADRLFVELILGLASLPQPKCALFKSMTLIALLHYRESLLFEKDGKSHLRIEFAGNHSLTFQYDDPDVCVHDCLVIRKLLCLDEKRTQLN